MKDSNEILRSCAKILLVVFLANDALAPSPILLADPRNRDVPLPPQPMDGSFPLPPSRGGKRILRSENAARTF